MAKTPIPERLKEARKRAEFSQTELGVAAGMDPSGASARMNQYERDKHVPDYQTLKRIAGVLGCPVPYFYAEDDTLAEILLHLGRLDESGKAALLEELRKASRKASCLQPDTA
ncbi:MAG: helix-turn-helix transcriptional regulator [Magnetococcales bacterium]|nr:helix-turn-helix transcriptional regulator [Magnetococcales bacterium]